MQYVELWNLYRCVAAVQYTYRNGPDTSSQSEWGSERARKSGNWKEREREAPFNVYEIKFLPLAKCVRVDRVVRTERFCRGQWWRSRAHVRAFAPVNVHFNYGWKNEIAAHTQLNWVEHARTRTCFRVDKCIAIWLPFACINSIANINKKERKNWLACRIFIERYWLPANNNRCYS